MKKFKIKTLITYLLVISLVMAVFTGCTAKSNDGQKTDDKNESKVEEDISSVKYPIEVEDQFGSKVTIDKKPERIISLSPSHTEILFALDLGEKIVGNTTYCDYPEEAKKKEKVGDAMTINIEKVIELNPDLVIQYGSGTEEVNNKLKDAGIAIVSYEPESIEDVTKLIKEVGKITDTADKAEKLVKDMESRKNEIVEKVKNAEKTKVFYETWNDPLTAAGPGSFINELIELAGGENIAKDAKSKYPQFDLEKLIERNPDVYISADMSKQDKNKTVDAIKSRPGYETINAIKNDKVYLVEPNIISRPGPRIIEALEIVAKCIHPDIFK